MRAKFIISMPSILAISAYPDDESLFAGGTLAMYAEQGHRVYILETTRGEGGEVGEPPLTTEENLGAFREQEVRKAARELGVSPAELRRANFIGEFPYQTPVIMAYDAGDFEASLNAAMAAGATRVNLQVERRRET